MYRDIRCMNVSRTGGFGISLWMTSIDWASKMVGSRYEKYIFRSCDSGLLRSHRIKLKPRKPPNELAVSLNKNGCFLHRLKPIHVHFLQRHYRLHMNEGRYVSNSFLIHNLTCECRSVNATYQVWSDDMYVKDGVHCPSRQFIRK